MKHLPFAFALVTYLIFGLVYLCFAIFLLDLGGFRTERSAMALVPSILIDAGLVTLFGLAHSVMARPFAKRLLTRIVPTSAERAIYSLQSSLFLWLIIWFWQPFGPTIWLVQGAASIPIYLLFAVGSGIILLSTILLGHGEFFGLRQARSAATGRDLPAPEFRTPSMYRYVRHPLQSGILVILVATPHMTGDHLLLIALMCGYMAIGLRYEERALIAEFGGDYEYYRQTTPALIPFLRPRRGRLRA